jgi:hypothetical protein
VLTKTAVVGHAVSTAAVYILHQVQLW